MLRTAVESPAVANSAFPGASQLWSTATYDEAAGTVAVFACNRSVDTALDLTVDLHGFAGGMELVEHLSLFDDDPHAINDLEHPDRVVPKLGDGSVRDGVATAALPPASWHVLRFAAGG